MEPHNPNRESRRGFLGRLATLALGSLAVLPVMGGTAQAGWPARWRRYRGGRWRYGYGRPGYGYGMPYRRRFNTYRFRPVAPPVYRGYPGYNVPRGFQRYIGPPRSSTPVYPPPMM